MKYTYIISIILSSFFTYKSVSANINYQQYAFFIPNGAFQQNQRVQDIRLMRPRYTETQDTTQENQVKSDNFTAPIQPVTTTSSRSNNRPTSSNASYTPNRSKSSLANRKKTTFPITKNKPTSIQKITTSQPTNMTAPSATNIIFQEETPPSAVISEETTQKLKEYKLDENTQITTTEKEIPAKPKLSRLEDLKQQSLSKLLNDIPYPDSSQPRFTQLYSYYGMELRVYQRRGKFPSNRKQEETLAKANSIKHFDVK